MTLPRAPAAATEPSDIELVDAVLRAAPGAVEAFYRRHSQLIYHCIRARADRQDVDDIFQAFFERLMALWHRALLVIDDSRGRDLDRLYANFFEVQPTIYFGVPRVYNGMITRAEEEPKAREALKRLRFAFSAAAPISEPAFRWFESLGVPVLEGWGLTETSPFASYNHRLWYKLGSIGSPIENVEMRIVDPDSGIEVATGEAGEIAVRGPNVMLGYWNDEAATRAAVEEGVRRAAGA